MGKRASKKRVKTGIVLGIGLAGMSSFYIRGPVLENVFISAPALGSRLLTPSVSNLCISSPTSMDSAQIRCQGCDKVFSPRGLSQHLSKDSACRASQALSTTPSVFQNGPAGSFRACLGSISNYMSDRRVVDLRNGYSGE